MATKKSRREIEEKIDVYTREVSQELNRRNILPLKERIQELKKRYFLAKQAEPEWGTIGSFRNDEDNGFQYRLSLDSAAAGLMEAQRCINSEEECSVDLGYIEFLIENQVISFDKERIIKK